MGLEPEFARSAAAAIAAAWIALVALGSPAPGPPGRWPWTRLTPRLSILGALAVATLFAALAAWQNGGIPDIEAYGLDPDGFWVRLAPPARTLAMGAAILAIVAAMAGLSAWIGARSRVAARGAVLFAVLLLAGAVWPLFSIPRWCEHAFAPEEAPAASPLAFHSPDCDPARWVEAWLVALHPLSAWGMAAAAAGGAASLVAFRRATARADAAGREAAVAALACCGVLLLGLGALDIDKRAAWAAHESHRERSSYWCDSSFQLSVRCYFGAGDLDLDSIEFSYGGGEVEPSSRYAPLSLWNCVCPAPATGPPLPPWLAGLAAGAGLFAVLFGEFHLRGRRLLRDPDTGEVVPAAP